MADAIAEPQSSSYTGLTDAEARERLRQYGPNVLPSGHRLTLFSIVLGTLKEPMLILLLSTGLVYLLVGDLREAIAILASIFMVIGISTTQKHRTERTLEALRDLTSPRALVMRSEGRDAFPPGRWFPETSSFLMKATASRPTDRCWRALCWRSMNRCLREKVFRWISSRRSQQPRQKPAALQWFTPQRLWFEDMESLS